jgi:hypothetical protein
MRWHLGIVYKLINFSEEYAYWLNKISFIVYKVLSCNIYDYMAKYRQRFHYFYTISAQYCNYKKDYLRKRLNKDNHSSDNSKHLLPQLKRECVFKYARP